jgi:hypothetical protein
MVISLQKYIFLSKILCAFEPNVWLPVFSFCGGAREISERISRLDVSPPNAKPLVNSIFIEILFLC